MSSIHQERTPIINPRLVVLEAITWRETALRLARYKVMNLLGANNKTPHAPVAGPSARFYGAARPSARDPSASYQSRAHQICARSGSRADTLDYDSYIIGT